LVIASYLAIVPTRSRDRSEFRGRLRVCLIKPGGPRPQDIEKRAGIPPVFDRASDCVDDLARMLDPVMHCVPIDFVVASRIQFDDRYVAARLGEIDHRLLAMAELGRLAGIQQREIWTGTNIRIFRVSAGSPSSA
jgi:hypothetical protein